MACTDCSGTCQCNSDCYERIVAKRYRALAKAACLGVNERSIDVQIITRTWSGSTIGQGTYTDEVVTITPRPKVSEVSPRYTANEGGKYARGRRRISDVHPITYAKADLDHTVVSTQANVERFYALDGKAYALDSEPIKKSYGWVFEVTRKRAEPGYV